MQKQNLLKERNGASLKPETQTPSSALDTAVVVIDEMTKGLGLGGEGEAEHAPSPLQREHVAVTTKDTLRRFGAIDRNSRSFDYVVAYAPTALAMTAGESIHKASRRPRALRPPHQAPSGFNHNPRTQAV
jgi:hypothetical protein